MTFLLLPFYSMYKLALETYPSHSSIHLKYAGFLRHVRRNMKGAEDEYRKAVETDPNHADALGNFASFLHSVYKDIPNAEKYYILAVQADETHANNLCNYGLFLRYTSYSRYDLFEIICFLVSQ